MYYRAARVCGAFSAAVAVATLTFGTPSGVAAPAPEDRKPARPSVVQTTFKSVDAVLAAQWDFPTQSPAPLVVLIPSGGRIDRNGWHPGLGEDASHGIYAQLTSELVAKGFAVFRYDKPGAGRSSPGRFATERSNAIEAYTRAIDHARVDPERVFLLGHSIGTDTIAGIFPRFEAVAAPVGTVLLDSMVGETASLRIKAPTLIVNSGRDPDDRYQYGEFVVESRERAEGKEMETELVVIDRDKRGLLSESSKNGATVLTLDPRATGAIVDWLMRHRAGDDLAAATLAPPAAARRAARPE